MAHYPVTLLRGLDECWGYELINHQMIRILQLDKRTHALRAQMSVHGAQVEGYAGTKDAVSGIKSLTLGSMMATDVAYKSSSWPCFCSGEIWNAQKRSALSLLLMDSGNSLLIAKYTMTLIHSSVGSLRLLVQIHVDRTGDSPSNGTLGQLFQSHRFRAPYKPASRFRRPGDPSPVWFPSTVGVDPLSTPAGFRMPLSPSLDHQRMAKASDSPMRPAESPPCGRISWLSSCATL